MIPRSETKLPNLTDSALYTHTPNEVTKFVVHYGDSPTLRTAEEELATLKSYDSWHRKQGWGGIGYNLAVGPVTGNVYEARGLNRVGAHAKGHNRDSIGVVILGGDDALTEQAKQGLRRAYGMANDWAKKTLDPMGHRDVASTSCPGDSAYAWLASGGLTKGEGDVANYIMRQGVKVAPGTYAAYEKMRAAFKKATGYDLLITSGYRTYAEQKDLYDRWTGKKQPPFSAPSVAKPGTSRHENGRALDLRDSGASAGVTVAGNARSNWMRQNAHTFGFIANGYSFGEPWHFEYQGDPWVAGSVAPPSTSKPVWSASYIKDIQDRLIRLGFSVGNSGIDGSKGPDTDRGILAFQKKYGLTQDALPGPDTLKALKVVELQKAVRATMDNSVGPDTKKRVDAVRKSSRWGGNKFPYGVKFAQQVVGTMADNSWGPNSVKAHDRTVKDIQRAVGVKQDSIWGRDTDTAVRGVGA